MFVKYPGSGTQLKVRCCCVSGSGGGGGGRECHDITTFCVRVGDTFCQISIATHIGTKVQEITKIPDCPRRKAVAEFQLCVAHDCLGTHLHRTGIRPDPYCMLCSLHEPMDRNHLGQCTALFNRTECERYWEDRTKMMEK